MRVALLDLGVGNLHSLAKAVAAASPGAEVTVESEARAGLRADVLVLPGVGAFPAAAERLRPARAEVQRALLAGGACVGICLGMQLLFESSEEGEGEGLGVFEGRVTRLGTTRSPHMGWSPLAPSGGAPAWAWPPAVYYAHSFACRPARGDVVLATTDLVEDRVVAVVRRDRVVGCQFHPEKSSREGVALLASILREIGP